MSEDFLHALELVPELLDSVNAVEGDPGGVRLSPTAYLDDPIAQEDYQRMIQPELERQRTADRAQIGFLLTDPDGSSDQPRVITDDQADALLRVLNESRLVLAARLGIEEEGWGSDPDPPEETPPAMLFLHFLTYLQDALVQAMSAKL